MGRTNVNREAVAAWLEQLKAAWEGKRVDEAVELFAATKTYYERPFKAGTTRAEIEGYWRDIVTLEDIRFEYEVRAVEGNTACVHWQNSFRAEGSDSEDLLDGIFVIEFDDAMRCTSFAQWWFAK